MKPLSANEEKDILMKINKKDENIFFELFHVMIQLSVNRAQSDSLLIISFFVLNSNS